MKTLSRIALILSVLCLVASFTSAGSSVYYGALKPAGAIFFIVFFISNLLKQPYAEYDAELEATHPERKTAVNGGNDIRPGAHVPQHA